MSDRFNILLSTFQNHPPMTKSVSPSFLPPPSMSLLPLLLPLSLLLLTTHTHSSSTCQPFQCGDHNIFYPFSLYDDNTPEHCGIPGLLISCEDGYTPILHLNSEKYAVRGIDYVTHTITLVDADVVDQSCPRVQNNVSLFTNSGVTFTTSDINLIFFFNCYLPSDTVDQNYTSISCFSTDTAKGKSYVVPTDLEPYQYLDLLYSCHSVVVAPVLENSLELYNPNLSTAFGKVLQSGFQLGWNLTSNCTDCERRKGQCGYVLLNDNSTYKFNCYCSNGSCGKKGYTAVVIGASVAAAVAFFLLFIVCAVLHICKKTRPSYASENKTFCFDTKERRSEKLVQVTLESFESLLPKRYSFSEIRRITKSFNQKIGQGGYASVFKGELMDGTPVAVKVFKDRESSGVEFTSEVVSIARTSHVNIVRLVGFSINRSKRALIYEFMPNGSLDKYLCENQNSTLTHVECTRLFEIAVGIARGLEYLHRGCNTRIVHFDIKPHNILLDQEYCPKISDFGLAKFCQPKESILSMSGLRGTIGYIAPEVFSRNFGVVSSKSDVYSYGMMVLEMFGGKQSKMELTDSSSDTYFPDYIYKCVELNNICSVFGVSDVCEEIVKKVTIVGLWCIQVMPHARPTMSAVLDMLDKSIEELALPPPSNVSPPPVLIQEATDFKTSTLSSHNGIMEVN